MDFAKAGACPTTNVENVNGYRVIPDFVSFEYQDRIQVLNGTLDYYGDVSANTSMCIHVLPLMTAKFDP